MNTTMPELEPALSQIGAIALLNKDIISFLHECMDRGICPDDVQDILGRVAGGKLLQEDIFMTADHHVAVICTNCGDFTSILEKISKEAHKWGQKDVVKRAVLLLCCLFELEAKAKEAKAKGL